MAHWRLVCVAVLAGFTSLADGLRAEPPAAAGGGLDAQYEVACIPHEMVDRLRLDTTFYTKYVDASGYPVISSAQVNDYALFEAAYLVDCLLSHRADVRRAMVDSGSRLVVIAHNEVTTDIPEYRELKPKVYWDRRARGLGGSTTDPVCSAAEENLLGYAGDPYREECILIHEFAHSLHLRGLVRIDPTFDQRLEQAFQRARELGLWKGTYAGTNTHEYWAEGVQSWFNNNRPPDHDHNHVDTRAELRDYDPGLSQLLQEVFGPTELHYCRPVERTEPGHLAGYNFTQSPTFRWPDGLNEAYQKLQVEREGSSDDSQ